MFQERPFRQQRHSFWSIWWFVGLMATGLTAWHLELIPYVGPVSVDSVVLDPAFAPGTEPSLLSELELGAKPMPIESFAAGEFDPAFAPNSSPQPAAAASSPVPAGSSIELASYETPMVEQTEPEPVDEFSPRHEHQVQTLTYQAQVDPVPVRPIPNATSLPIQTASYESRQRMETPTQTAALPTPPLGRYDRPAAGQPAEASSYEPQAMPAQPETAPAAQNPPPVAPLSPQAEQDIVRLRELSAQYWKYPETRGEIQEEIQMLAQKIFFRPETHYLPKYEIQPGDQLRLIARDYQVSWQYLSRLNQVEPEKIRPGKSLKVIKGPFGAVVDLSSYTLTIHSNGYYVCSYPIGTGRQDSTPTGEFQVLNKVENPTYYGSESVISADDPSNPLGEHWIDLGNSYGIHGTIDPSSIGHSMSKGCIRMLADDVAMVYDLLTLDSQVMIRP